MTPILLILLSNMTPRNFVRSISPSASIFEAFQSLEIPQRQTAQAKRFA
jgi:hypothetical protein